MWYLRADCPEDKQNWIEVLQSYKTEAISCSDNNNLRRQKWGSSVSLQSQTLSTASGCEVDRTGRTLKEKLHEIETFRDILYNQIDTLQRYFDAAASQKPVNGMESHLELGNGLKTIDFKGEAITFRATTAGVLTTLQHCVDIILQKDENLKRKLDKEIERRKRAEDQVKACKEELDKSKKATLLGPDLEVRDLFLCKHRHIHTRETLSIHSLCIHDMSNQFDNNNEKVMLVLKQLWYDVVAYY